MKRALVIGVTGQDGAFLAEFLLRQGYAVWGSTRELETARLGGLQSLGIHERVQLLELDPTIASSVDAGLQQARPDEVYLLAAQSSVGLSFEQPAATLDGCIHGMLNLLEAMRCDWPQLRLFHASSAECFGECPVPADAQTPMRPLSPYGVAKAAAHWLLHSYRAAYGLYACNGILFNHESPLRPARFVSRKIIAAAQRIAAGSGEHLSLGRIDIMRDWGWAPEYVEAMWRMLQCQRAEDLVLATGVSFSLQQFVAEAFAQLELDWRDHVRIDPALVRANEALCSRADPSRAAEVLGWRAEVQMPEVIRRLHAAQLGGEPDG